MRIGLFLTGGIGLVLLLLAPVRLSAQTGLGSEEEVKKAAATNFDEGNYSQAHKLYSQLLSTYPKDPNYNYRFGVCILFSQADKDEALKYLEKASKDASVEKEVFFYLGKAYHLNYRFDDAIRAYDTYKKVAGPKKAETFQVDNAIASCRTGKKLLKSITDITVIDKKELPVNTFLSAYDLSGYSGKLLVKPDDFKTPLDKKKKETSAIFLSSEKTEIYFSSYGNDESNGKDIYIIRKLPNGDWSKPQNVGYPINTEYDEDYPFLHPNGKVLYFCSKGHNSMGGYDIFKSTLNEETNTWTKPVNLDFAINTPDDDILYVTDFEEKTAYFSSSRSSPSGQMTVYHVNVDRRPVEMCIVKGVFQPTEGSENRAARIVVKNMETGDIVGVFKSNEQTGNYLLNLPNTGKFNVTAEKSGVETQSALMIIPTQYEIKPLAQEMGYRNGKFYINTLFDNDTAQLSSDFLKDRAKLDVDNNYSGPQVTDIGSEPTASGTVKGGTTGGTTSTGGTTDTGDTGSSTTGGTTIPKSISNEDLVKQAYADATDTKKEADDLRTQADQALAYAMKKNQDAHDKNAEADKAQKEADAATDPQQKKDAQDRADDLRAQANGLETETVGALAIADALDKDATSKKKEGEVSADYAKKLEAAVKSKSKDALDKLDDQQKQLEMFSNAPLQSEDAIAGIKSESATKHGELDKAKAKATEAHDELKETDTKIAELEGDAAKEKDPQLKESILASIGNLKDERKDLQKDADKADAKLAQVQAETDNIDVQLLGVNTMMDQVKNGTGPNVLVDPADRKKLDQDVLAYQREVVESPDKRPIKTGTGIGSAGTDVATTGGTTTGGTTTGGTDVATTGGTTTGGTDVVTTDSGTRDADPVTTLNTRFNAPLEAAAKSDDPYERESTKAEVYNDWVQAIDVAIEKQKEALGGTKDKKQKQEINTAIAALQKEKKEKESLAHQSEEKSDALKLASLTASTTGGTTTTTGGTTDPVQTMPVYEQQFTSQVAAADTISNPYEREKKKTSLYKEWAAAIDASITEKKKEQAAAKDKTEKDRLKTELQQLQTASAETKKKQKESETAAVTAKKEQDQQAADNPQLALENTFGDQVKKAADDSTKAALYTAWVDALDSTIAKKKEELAKARDNAKRTKLQQQIDVLSLQAEEKQSLASEAEARFEKTSSGATDVATTGGTTTGGTTTGGTTTGGTTTGGTDVATTGGTTTGGTTTGGTTTGGTTTGGTTTGGTTTGGTTTGGTDVATTGGTTTGGTTTGGTTTGGTTTGGTTTGGTDVATTGGTTTGGTTTGGTTTGGTTTGGTTTGGTTTGGTDVATTGGTTTGGTTTGGATTGGTTSGGTTTGGTTTGGTTTGGTDVATTGGTTTGGTTTGGTTTGGTDVATTGGTTTGGTTTGGTTTGGTTTGGTTTGGTTTGGTTTGGTTTGGTTTGGTTTGGTTTGGTTTGGTDVATTGGTTTGGTTTGGTTTGGTTTGATTSTTGTTPVNPLSGQPFTKDELVTVRSSEPYKNYISLKQDADKSAAQAAAQHKIADDFKSTSVNYISQSQEIAEAASVVSDAGKKQEMLDKAHEYNDLAILNRHKADSASEIADNADAAARSKDTEADLFLQELDKDTYEQVKVVATADRTPNTADVATTGGTTTGGTTTGGTTTGDTTTGGTTTGGTTTGGTTTGGTTTGGSTTGGTASTATGTGPNTSAIASRLGSNESYALRTSPAYSNEKRIPVDATLPDGVIFKVQIGAFRNAIPQDIFKGITPISGETTPQGFTRYTAGVFTSFGTADAAKKEIRRLGFPDAFVVAFRNGKRISMEEATNGAVNSAGVATTCGSTTGGTTTGGSTTGGTTTGGTTTGGSTTGGTTTGGSTSGGTTVASDPNAAPTTSVDQLKGLFFTVQVGVYKREVSRAQLYNLDDLFSERTSNGYIRYSCGSYNNLDAAVESKNKIVSRGIRDAFVTAYYNGKRLTPAEAATLLASGTATSGASSSSVGTTGGSTTGGSTTGGSTTGGSTTGGSTSGGSTTGGSTTGGSTTGGSTTGGSTTGGSTTGGSTTGGSTTGGSTTGGSTTDGGSSISTPVSPVLTDTGLVYRVQIGAFSQEVPLDIANKFLQLARRGVRNYKDDQTGYTVYVVGANGKYADAETLKAEAVEKGITDAFVVAFYKGKKISLDEAKQKSGE